MRRLNAGAAGQIVEVVVGCACNGRVVGVNARQCLRAYKAGRDEKVEGIGLQRGLAQRVQVDLRHATHFITPVENRARREVDCGC